MVGGEHSDLAIELTLPPATFVLVGNLCDTHTRAAASWLIGCGRRRGRVCVCMRTLMMLPSVKESSLGSVLL